MLHLSGHHTLPLILRVLEVLCLGLASLTAYWLRMGLQVPDLNYLLLTLTGVISFAVLGRTPHHLRSPLHVQLLQQMPRTILAVVGSIGLVVMLLFLLKISQEYSRIWLATWLILAITNIILLRAAAMQMVEYHLRRGRWARRVVVVGIDKKALDVIEHLAQQHPVRAKIVGLYTTKTPEASASLLKSPYYKGTLEILLQNRNRIKADDVIIALDLDRYPDGENLLSKLHQLPLHTYYCLPHTLFARAPHAQDDLYRLPLVMLFRHPLQGTDLLIKRLIDIAGSLAALTLFAPLMALIALAIKLDSRGPIFFRQTRGGFNGSTFQMLKFRSMVANAHQMRDADGKEQQATRNDARITRVGRFLRKTSLDELPQLINVLKGDMSLVGPRPHALSHDSHYGALINRYASRHKMLPGLTGWAQLNGWRGETETVEDMAKRIEFDIWYAENWQWQLDLKILLLTPFVVFFQRRAY